MKTLKLLPGLLGFLLFPDHYIQAQQTGTCTAGTEFCESLDTTNDTTTNNTNTNTNVNTNTNNNTNVNTNANTNINTSTNANTNVNTNQNTNVSTNSNNNVNTSTATSNNTNSNNNVNTSTSNSTVNSTVNQNVTNSSTSNNTNVNTSNNTNVNTSKSDSNVTTNNKNVNQNNNKSDNTNRNINESNSTQTINQNVKSEAPPASAIAPSIMSYSQDLCTVGPVRSIPGPECLGFSRLVATVTDQNCERLKLSKYLYDTGMKVASVSILCQDERVFKAMEMAGTPCPYKGKIGKEATLAWADNKSKRPDAKEQEELFIKQCTNDSNPKREKINKDVVGAVKVIYTRKTKTTKQCKKEFYATQ